MGCDIHGVVEKKHNGEWVGIHNFRPVHSAGKETSYTWWAVMDRHYEFFAALAGVRGDGPDSLGVPDDASALTLMLTEGEYDHSYSYLNISEFLIRYINVQSKEAQMEMAKLMFDRGVRWVTYYTYNLLGIDVSDDESLDDYRVVFWFDN